jgi:hypothetical protein
MALTVAMPTIGAVLIVRTARLDWSCHEGKITGGSRRSSVMVSSGTANHAKRGTEASGSELGPIKAIYDYTDEVGKLLFQVLRFEPLNAPKQFRQRRSPDQKKWSIKGARIVPFRLPELITAIAQELVFFVCEGEKDVLTLARHNIPPPVIRWAPANGGRTSMLSFAAPMKCRLLQRATTDSRLD